MLRVHDLHYRYEDGHEALKGITFSLSEGEKTALVGANGSGKSTLLMHLAGALKVQTGKITLNASTGLIFQDSDDQLLMPSVIEDVAFTLTANGMNIKHAHERAKKILDELGISHLASRPPHKLSGGEKKMVTIAGVLVSEPDILLLDEPTAGLDPKARRRVINFLRESDKTILLASHDLDMTLDVCRRAIILHEGVISAEGELPELFMNRSLLEQNGLELPVRYS